MLTTITLPIGTNLVAVQEIPKLIADKLYPEISKDTPREVRELRLKRVCVDDSLASLTEVDREELKSIWAKLPELKLPITEQDWKPYQEAYDRNPPKGWKLELEKASPYWENVGMRNVVIEHWEKSIEKGVKDGKLTPIHPRTFAPQPEAKSILLKICVVTVQGLAGFLKEHNINLEFSTPCAIDGEFPTPNTSNAAKVDAVNGIRKGAVINAFEDIHFSRDQWSRALANLNSHPWLNDCWVSPPGVKGSRVSRTWNPVLIASALYGDNGKGIKIDVLDAVFVRLKDWAEE